MHRRILGLVLCFGLLLGVPAYADEAPVEEPVLNPTAQIYIDGNLSESLSATVFGGTAYVSLPLTAVALNSGVAYAWEEDRVVVRGEALVLSAKVDDCYLEVNGRVLYIPDGVKWTEEGDTLVPARVLAKALGCEIAWDGAVRFTTGGAPLEPGETFYDPQAVDLLARVIVHESGYQPFKGQLAVGNVILNRVKSPKFPDTIYDVIYEPGQFPGATSYEPDAEAILAAKLCLDGAVVVEGAYYFNGAGKPCWAASNRPLIAVIGGHAFYG